MTVAQTGIKEIKLENGTFCTVHTFMASSESFPPDSGTRQFDVILPPNYSQKEKYPLIFMYDGQNLYRDYDSWNAPQTAAKLAVQKKIPPVVIVGLYHGGVFRRGEYFPQKAWSLVPKSLIAAAQPIVPGGCKSGIYLDWVVNTIRPYVIANFPVTTEKQKTFIIGSSMGGLMSLNALIEYPDVFGGAACLSTHWTGTQKPLPSAAPYLIQWVKECIHDASVTKQRIYFDHGDGDGNPGDLDFAYAPHQNEIDKIMASHGYSESAGNFKSLSFEHAILHEKFWAERLPGALEFLLAK